MPKGKGYPKTAKKSPVKKSPVKKGQLNKDIKTVKIKGVVETKSAMPEISKREKRIEVSIKKAKNGYIVNSYDENYKDNTYVAKTNKEAKEYATKMLKI